MVTQRRPKLWQQWHDLAEAELPRVPIYVIVTPAALADLDDLPAELRREADDLLNQFRAQKHMGLFKNQPRLKPMEDGREYQGCWRIRFGYEDADEVTEWRIMLRPDVAKKRVFVFAVKPWRALFR